MRSWESACRLANSEKTCGQEDGCVPVAPCGRRCSWIGRNHAYLLSITASLARQGGKRLRAPPRRPAPSMRLAAACPKLWNRSCAQAPGAARETGANPQAGPLTFCAARQPQRTTTCASQGVTIRHVFLCFVPSVGWGVRTRSRRALCSCSRRMQGHTPRAAPLDLIQAWWLWSKCQRCRQQSQEASGLWKACMSACGCASHHRTSCRAARGSPRLSLVTCPWR